ncbi:MAG TPA: hypothetical protein VL860_04060 [Planctomycetota bacterium]|nr:hypothetical protein [Planctomycetota bacterium]
MTDLQNTPPPPKRSGLAWWLGGIGLAILLCILLCCGGVIGVGWFVGHQFSASTKFVEALKTDKPAKYSGPKMPQDQIDAAWNRCVDARETVKNGKVAALSLSDVELNNLTEERITANPDKPLGGMDIVAREGGVKGRISFEDDNQPGTFITLDADIDLAINGSQLTFALKSLKDPQGNEAPMAVYKLGELIVQAGLVQGVEAAKKNRQNNQTSQDLSQIQPTSPLYGLKTLKFTPGNIAIEIDPERVKAHNRAVGKADDAPLFGEDD